MRTALALPLALALVLPGTALAQVQQYNPNAANESLARQGEIRALNQQRVSDFNTLNMQMQRNVQYQPYAPDPGFYGVRRGVRHRSFARRGGGFNTGICVGC